MSLSLYDSFLEFVEINVHQDTLHSSKKNTKKTDLTEVNKRVSSALPAASRDQQIHEEEIMWVGEEMKQQQQHRESECVHVQQFPFPNNPPQCPPPLIIFLFLSHSPCPSFSRLLLSLSSSRLQLHYSGWPTQRVLCYLCLALPPHAFPLSFLCYIPLSFFKTSFIQLNLHFDAFVLRLFYYFILRGTGLTSSSFSCNLFLDHLILDFIPSHAPPDIFPSLSFIPLRPLSLSHLCDL